MLNHDSGNISTVTKSRIQFTKLHAFKTVIHKRFETGRT